MWWCHVRICVSGIASQDDERNVEYLVLNGQIPGMLTMAGIGVGDPWSLSFSIITASESEVWMSKLVTEFFLDWFLFCRRQALIQRELCHFLLTFSSTWTIYTVSICFYSKRKEKLKGKIHRYKYYSVLKSKQNPNPPIHLTVSQNLLHCYHSNPQRTCWQPPYPSPPKPIYLTVILLVRLSLLHYTH